MYHMKKTLPGFIEIKKLRNKKIYSESESVKSCFESNLNTKTNSFINYKNLI